MSRTIHEILQQRSILDEAFQGGDPLEPFPEDTISDIEKEINKLVDDEEADWKNAIELVAKAFEAVEIPLPQCHLNARWGQYTELLRYAVSKLVKSRGFAADWSVT